MNKIKLIAAGVNYAEGVNRFGGRSEVYEKYLVKFFDDPQMETLERQLAEKDVSGAFRTAHALKGAAGNLSLNEYYKKICVLTELLRFGNSEDDYSAALSQAKALYAAAAAAVREK